MILSEDFIRSVDECALPGVDPRRLPAQVCRTEDQVLFDETADVSASVGDGSCSSGGTISVVMSLATRPRVFP